MAEQTTETDHVVHYVDHRNWSGLCPASTGRGTTDAAGVTCPKCLSLLAAPGSGPAAVEWQATPEMTVAERGWKNLMIAVGKSALAKHQASCAVCTDDYSCEVANLHLDTIARLRSEISSPPGQPSDQPEVRDAD